MRTISIVKASLFTLILALMVTTVVAIAAVMKGEQSVVTPTETWLLIEPLDMDEEQDDTSNQKITSVLDPNVNDPGCNGDEIICAVKLTIPGSVSPSSLEGQTVEYALNQGANFATPSPEDSYRHRD